MNLLHVWRYTLRSARGLNAVSARTEHEGALIRVGEGFGCLHPWPELGDLVLADQLEILAAGGRTALIDGALRCAEADGRARQEGRPLFHGPTPESHWLALPGDDPEKAREDGFTAVKLKVGDELGQNLQSARLWADSGFRLRLDANESLDLATFFGFWKDLGDLCERVDFVEDPVPWHPAIWEELRKFDVPVAVDREAESRFRPGDVAVIKPAVSDWIPRSPERFVVTSAMDHGLGQLWAAAEASRLAEGPEGVRLSGCGLLTHRCFESDPFFERLRCDGPRLVPPGGTGLGFDDLLEGLPWKRLT